MKKSAWCYVHTKNDCGNVKATTSNYSIEIIEMINSSSITYIMFFCSYFSKRKALFTVHI